MRLAVAAVLAAALASAAAATAAAPAPSAPLVRFGGLDANQLAGVNPADVQVAAGPGAVVETVNSSIAIWSVAGATASVVSSQPLGVFFSGAGVDRSRDDMTDPRVLYDPVAGRWFAVAFDITRHELDVAVSSTPAPNAAWTVYALSSAGCPDQPRLGTSDAVVVVTDDLFSSCRGFGRFLGGEVIVLSKPDLLAAAATPRRATFGPDARFAAVTPAQSLGSTPTEYLVAIEQSGSAVQLLHVDGTDTASLPLTTIRLGTSLQDPPSAPQRGSFRAVDSGDNRAQNAIWDQGRIWLAATAACADGARSCARVIQLDAGAGKLVRDTTIDLSSRFLFYPAVAPDGLGNAVVGFGYSSPGDFPGMGYTYVRPDGSVAPPLDVAAGSSPNDSGRFGDYSGAARDPADPTRVWLASEIGQASDGTSFGWGSQVAAVKVPPQAPAVGRTAAVRAGASAATVTAELFPEGAPTVYRLDYGPTPARGTRAATAAVAATVRSQTVTASVSGLQPGRVYHLAFVATSPNGTTTGPDVTLRIPAAAPLVSSQPAQRAGTGTLLRALVAPRGAATTVVFEYGATRAYGARTAGRRVPAAAAPTLVSAPVRLVRGRLYHFRAVAASAKGTAVGADRTVRG